RRARRSKSPFAIARPRWAGMTRARAAAGRSIRTAACAAWRSEFTRDGSRMRYLLNVAYLCAVVAISPWLVYKAFTTGKYRRGMWAKVTGHDGASAKPQAASVWFHGVSVGEIHLLRGVVAKYRQRHPDHRVVVSTTTDTGFDEARKIFADLR